MNGWVDGRLDMAERLDGFNKEEGPMRLCQVVAGCSLRCIAFCARDFGGDYDEWIYLTEPK